MRKQHKKVRLELLATQDVLHNKYCLPCEHKAKYNNSNSGCNGCKVFVELQAVGAKLERLSAKKRGDMKQMALTVTNYRYWKDKGKTDKQIMQEFGMNNQQFYVWKEGKGLIKKRDTKTDNDTQAEKMFPKQEMPVPKEPKALPKVVESLEFQPEAKETENPQPNPKQSVLTDSELKRVFDKVYDQKQLIKTLQTEKYQLAEDKTREKAQFEQAIQELQQTNGNIQYDLLQIQEEHEATLSEVTLLKEALHKQACEIRRYEAYAESKLRWTNICNLLMQEVNSRGPSDEEYLSLSLR